MQRPHNLSRALNGGVGTLHGLDGDARRFGNHDGLPNIVLRELASDAASILYVFALLLGRFTLRQHAGFHQQGFEEPCGFFERDAFVGQDFCHRTEQRIGVAPCALFDELLEEIKRFSEGTGFSDDVCLVGIKLSV